MRRAENAEDSRRPVALQQIAHDLIVEVRDGLPRDVLAHVLLCSHQMPRAQI